MRLRVVVVLVVAMILLGGWVCGADLEPAGERVAASIPAPEPAETGSADVSGQPEPEPEPEAEPEADAPAVTAEAAACTSVPADLPLAERCAMAGAVVHTFGNTCAGGCKAKEQMMMCGQAMTDGCKCPEGQCIDDETGCCREIRR